MNARSLCDVDSSSDKSISEVVQECERELLSMTDWNEQPTSNVYGDQQNSIQNNERAGEKRSRKKSEGSSEEGFITVTRRKPKRLIRSGSAENLVGKNFTQTTVNGESMGDKYEVCLTSQQILPKQMALAKLLRNENISNIIAIRYKSPYKVFVHFDDKKQAENLVNNRRFVESGVRAQLTDQGNLSYGLVRGVDLEMSDDEIIQSLNCAVHIISVKRLRRVDIDGKWINCETIRVCFKSPTCPGYVTAFGCRFSVERFIFPVTQCSGCWKFGHPKKFCPTSKSLCPKCGGTHVNCEAENYTCVNCKGPHMALDKTCPMFLKEKKIRTIMSEENITYKKALEIYLSKKKIVDELKQRQNDFPPLQKPNRTSAAASTPPKMSDFFKQTKEKHVEEPTFEKNERTPQCPLPKRNKTKIPKPGMQQNAPMDEDLIDDGNNYEHPQTQQTDEEISSERKKDRKFAWRKIFNKIKDAIFSEDSLEGKIMTVVKFIFEEIKSFVIDTFADGDIFNRMLSLLSIHNG